MVFEKIEKNYEKMNEKNATVWILNGSSLPRKETGVSIVIQIGCIYDIGAMKSVSTKLQFSNA